MAAHTSGQHRWQDYISEAEDIRAQYEEQMKYIMREFSETPWKSSLGEVEVFVGAIVGREKSTRRQRELSINLKEQYDFMAKNTIYELKGETSRETLGKCMACLKICCPSFGMPSAYKYRSFAWVVSSVLISEVEDMTEVEVVAF